VAQLLGHCRTPIHGGSAMADAAAVQNLMKPRRLMPCLRSISPTVKCFIAAGMARTPLWFEKLVAARAVRRGAAGHGHFDLIGRRH
jgi:hypothetical protein